MTMKMLTLGNQPTWTVSPWHSRELQKRVNARLIVEDAAPEFVRGEIEALWTGNFEQPTHRRRGSSFVEVPILDRRRRSEDDNVEKRVRVSMERIAVPMREEIVAEEQPRKQRMCLLE